MGLALVLPPLDEPHDAQLKAECRLALRYGSYIPKLTSHTCLLDIYLGLLHTPAVAFLAAD